MEITDFKNAIRTQDQAQLQKAVDFAMHNLADVQNTLVDIVKSAASEATSLEQKEDRTELNLALMILAANRKKEIFPELFRLVRKKNLAEQIPEDDWFFRELHRLFGSLSEPDDIDAFGDLVLDPQVSTQVREQALLTLHFLWIEKIVPEKDIIEEYKRLLSQGLDAKDDWKLWMALIINAAVVGGNKLKPQVMEILDSGKLLDQTSFVRKVVNGLFNNGNAQFRQMLKNEHKGFLQKMPEEIENFCNPPQEEQIEMPEKGKPQTRETPKIGRNDPCPCGSGKKYKKCCGKNK